MIIVALRKLDHGEGVPVTAVAKMLHVDPTFVMTQSRLLEKKGFVRLTAVSDYSGTENLFLTDKAYRHFAEPANPLSRPEGYQRREQLGLPNRPTRAAPKGLLFIWKRPRSY